MSMSEKEKILTKHAEPRLKMFGLPDTFPSFMVPQEVHQFIAMACPGMTKVELFGLAQEYGFKPLWQELPNMGDNVYGFGLDINGLSIPLMVDMNFEESAHGTVH